MSVLVPTTPQAIGPVTALNIIKAIEELGGSRGYLEHIKSANSIDQIARPLSLLSFSNALGSDTETMKHHHNCSIVLYGGIAPGMLFGEINVFEILEEGVSIRIKYKAQIRAWLTKGSGRTDLHGNFIILTSWEDLLKSPTKFTIVAAEGKGLHAVFRRDFLPAAEISADFPEASGSQCGSYTCEGVCKWEEIIYVD